jgi:hypothetical protein
MLSDRIGLQSMNLKDVGRKGTLPIARYCPSIYLQQLYLNCFLAELWGSAGDFASI